MKGNQAINIKGGLLMIKYGYDVISQSPTGVVNVDSDDRSVAEQFIKECVLL